MLFINKKKKKSSDAIYIIYVIANECKFSAIFCFKKKLISFFFFSFSARRAFYIQTRLFAFQHSVIFTFAFDNNNKHKKKYNIICHMILNWRLFKMRRICIYIYKAKDKFSALTSNSHGLILHHDFNVFFPLLLLFLTSATKKNMFFSLLSFVKILSA